MSGALQQFLAHIDYSYPLTHNLAALDTFLKTQTEGHSSPSGLMAYEHICRQYLKNTSSMASSNKQRPLDTESIDDPQVLGQFSFAKKDGGFRHINEVRNQKTLFKEHQEKSAKVPANKLYPKEQKNYTSAFALPVANIGPDPKGQSRMKLAELQNKEDELVQWRKQRVLNEFFKCVEFEKVWSRHKLKVRSAIYHRQLVILKKAMTGLHQIILDSQEKMTKADNFSHRYYEDILQDYFEAWSQRARMTEEEREFEAEIERKQQNLSCSLAIHLLQKHLKKTRQASATRQQIRQSLHKRMIDCMRLKFLTCFKRQHHQRKSIHHKQKMTVSMIAVNEVKLLCQITRRLKLEQKIEHEANTKKWIMQTSGYKLINSLRNEWQTKKVYWRQPSKIILLNILLEAVCDELKRKGYRQQWMEQVEPCLKLTDARHGDVYRKFKLRKWFFGMRSYLEDERRKIEQVKMIRGYQLLSKLANNYLSSFVAAKIEVKTEKLSDYLASKRRAEGISTFKSCSYHELPLKQRMLVHRIVYGRVREVLQLWRVSYHVQLKHEQLILSFRSYRQSQTRKRCFQGMRDLLFQDIINQRIVEQALRLRTVQMQYKIFTFLQTNALSQKIIKKRIRRVEKVRLIRGLDKLLYSMRVGLYGKEKSKMQQLEQKKDQLTTMIRDITLTKMMKWFTKQKTKAFINKQISMESNIRHGWRYFNFWKQYSMIKKQNKKLGSEITVKLVNTKKTGVLNQMISKTVRSILLKRMARIVSLFALRRSWDAILNDVIVDKYEENADERQQ